MLLNLQQFAYDQIAGLKVYFSDRLESIKESYSEEIEQLYEALAESCKRTNVFQEQAVTFVAEKANKEDNSSQVIEGLQLKLDLETDRANIMTEKFDDVDAKLTKLNSEYEELMANFEKLTEK